MTFGLLCCINMSLRLLQGLFPWKLKVHNETFIEFYSYKSEIFGILAVMPTKLRPCLTEWTNTSLL